MEYFKADKDLNIYYPIRDGVAGLAFVPKDSLWTRAELRRHIPGVDPASVPGLERVVISKNNTYRAFGVRFACEN